MDLNHDGIRLKKNPMQSTANVHVKSNPDENAKKVKRHFFRSCLM